MKFKAILNEQLPLSPFATISMRSNPPTYCRSIARIYTQQFLNSFLILASFLRQIDWKAGKHLRQLIVG
ncbi:hypothetical protein ATE69_09350 [Sphingopyxis sp. H071]|nr:hypothetical protein ATE69_09350 [Sphingopyxis sp. H071]